MQFNQKKIGNVAVMMGVVAWVPFIFLVASGQEPPIYPFLAVHLIGVISGARLRAQANSTAAGKKPRRAIIGRILIILGVLAWAPYLYQTEVLGHAVEMRPFLVLHLTGVLGGLLLILSVPLVRVYKQSRFNSLP